MIFRRGILLGIFLIIGSIDGIVNGGQQFFWKMDKSLVIAILILSSFLGIIQITVSINYFNSFKTKVLLVCFILEAVYYVVVTIILINMNIILEMKIFGGFIFFILMIIICTAIDDLMKI